jgi:hypothetical protein
MMAFCLHKNSQSTALANQFKPAILQCFGDIAGAIGGHFETYLSVVAQVLQQAAGVQASPDGSYEMFDYVISLREGIMDAWGGIIGAMKAGGKSEFCRHIRCLTNLSSYLASTLCRVYLLTSQHRLFGPEQKRCFDAIIYGSHWVGTFVGFDDV